MACEVFGDQVTVTSTAQNLTTLLGLATRKFYSTLVLRAAVANTADIGIGKSDVTTTTNQLGFLQAGEALTVDIQGFISTDDLYLIAASSQTAHIMGVV